MRDLVRLRGILIITRNVCVMDHFGRSIRTGGWGRKRCSNRARYSGRVMTEVAVNVRVRMVLIRRICILRGMVWQSDQLLAGRNYGWRILGVRLTGIARRIWVALTSPRWSPVLIRASLSIRQVRAICGQNLVVGFHAF